MFIKWHAIWLFRAGTSAVPYPVSLFWETQFHQVHTLHMLHTEGCSPSPGAAQKQQTVCTLYGRAAVPSAPLQNMYQKDQCLSYSDCISGAFDDAFNNSD